MENYKYIITGASGWLGKRLLRKLSQNNHHTKGLLMPQDGYLHLNFHNNELVKGDITNKDSLREFFENSEGSTLIHLAGVIHPKLWAKDFYNINFKGTKNVIECAIESKVKRIIIMSSNSPIGATKNSKEVFDEDSPYNPYMGYGYSKYLIENYINSINNRFSTTDIVLIRAPWFYGPEQPERQTRFFKMIKEGRFPIIGSGLNRRSMVYVDNLVEGIILASKTKIASGKTYWIADKYSYTMNEIIQTIQSLLIYDFGIKVNTKALKLPSLTSDIARAIDWSLQKCGLYNQEIHVLSEMNLTIACSIDKAKTELNYSPKVELKEGMRQSIQYVLKNYGDI